MVARARGIPPRFAGRDEPIGSPQVAVVIDVMRAFTATAAALGAGAREVLLAASAQDALALKARHPGSVAWTDGELEPGFDCGNSPVQVGARDLAGVTCVATTSAGTVGAHAAKGAGLLFTASFTVAAATARAVRAAGADDVTYVITGARTTAAEHLGRAEEDLACAEYIAAMVAGENVTADGYLERARRSPAADRLREGIRLGYPGIDRDDVELCLDLDRFPFAMVVTAEAGVLALRARMS